MSAATTSNRFPLAQAFVRDLRSPERGLAGQVFRFVLSGSLVAVVYLTVTTVLHDAFAVPFQIALAAGFVVGVALHFTLQRVFVWKHHESFALSAHHQALRYLCLCLAQYGITALFTSQLPDRLGLPVEVVYVVTALGLAGLNFVVFRGRIFQPIDDDDGLLDAEHRQGGRAPETVGNA